jgi:hypothetical protein
MKNWKTTLGGILAAVGLTLTSSTNTVLHISGVVLAAVGTLLTGGAAADGNPNYK